MSQEILTFTVDGRYFAIPLENIQRVINSVEVTIIPDLQENILGIVKIHSEIYPVFNFRKKLGLPEKDISINDHFIIAKTTLINIIIIADKVLSVSTYDKQDLTVLKEYIYSNKEIKGVVSVNKDLTLIYDLETFLSRDEANTLNDRLENIKE